MDEAAAEPARLHLSRAWLWAVPLGVLVMLLPALWNGFPLFYYDTYDYIRLPFGAELPVFRTAPYGVFTWTGKIAGSLWGVVAVQSLLVTAALWLIAEALAPRGRTLATFGLMMAAAAVGGLPWYTGQIIADSFAGVTILGLAVLALYPDRLGPARKAALAAIATVAVALHTSHIGLAAGLVLLAALCMLGRRVWSWVPPVRLLLPAACLAGGILLVLGSNWAATGRVFLTQPAIVQTLGLFVENGLAKRYLDVVCPGKDPPPHRLCPHRNGLPKTANAFLWGPGPFEALGEFEGMEDEAALIVSGASAMFPGGLAWQSVLFTLRQFGMVDLGDGVLPLQFMMREPIAEDYPGDVAAYDAARQQRGAIDFEPIRPFELPLYLAAVAATLVLGLRAARRSGASGRSDALLAGAVAMGLLGNAFICGALSNPNHRYQGRVAWVPMAAVLVLAFRQRVPPPPVVEPARR